MWSIVHNRTRAKLCLGPLSFAPYELKIVTQCQVATEVCWPIAVILQCRPIQWNQQGTSCNKQKDGKQIAALCFISITSHPNILPNIPARISLFFSLSELNLTSPHGHLHTCTHMENQYRISRLYGFPPTYPFSV